MAAGLCRTVGAAGGEGWWIGSSDRGWWRRGVVGCVGCSKLHATVIMSGSSYGCGGLVHGFSWMDSGGVVERLWGGYGWGGGL